MTWIKCSDELPPVNKEVLVTDGTSIYVGELWEDGYGFVDSIEYRRIQNATHWQPLPKLPTEPSVQKDDNMELSKAIEIVLDVYGGNRPVSVTELAEAIDVVLEAMRSEITTSEAIKWCIEHKPQGETNVG